MKIIQILFYPMATPDELQASCRTPTNRFCRQVKICFQSFAFFQSMAFGIVNLFREYSIP